MGTQKESQETKDITSEFNFDELASSLGLSRKITQVLRQEELVSKEALSLLELKDLKELSFPMGTIKIILIILITLVKLSVLFNFCHPRYQTYK